MSSFIELDSFWRDRSAYRSPFNYEVTPDQIYTWNKFSRETRNLPTTPCKRSTEFVATVNVKVLTIPYPRAELFGDTHFASLIDAAGGISINPLITVAAGDIVEAMDTNGDIIRGTQYEISAVVPLTSFTLIRIGGGALTTISQSYNNTNNMLRFIIVRSVTNNIDILNELESAREILKMPRLYIDFHCRRYNDTDYVNSNGRFLRNIKFVAIFDKFQCDENLRPVWIHYKCDMEQTFRFLRNDPVVLTISGRDGNPISEFIETNNNIVNPLKQTMITFCITPYTRDGDYTNHSDDPI